MGLILKAFESELAFLAKHRCRVAVASDFWPHLMMQAGITEVTKLTGFGLGGTKFEAMALGRGGSTLSAGINSVVTTITVTSGTNYPTSGTVRLTENSPTAVTEEITYTGKSGNDLTGCTRGANSTPAASHASGIQVVLHAVATQTTLFDEITTGGGARKSGGTPNVTISLQTVAFANDTVRFLASWTFTLDFGQVTNNAINEISIHNGSGLASGDPPTNSRMLLKQVLNKPLSVVSSDTLTGIIDVTASDAATSGTSTVTRSGIVEGNKLYAKDLTATGAGIKSIALGTGTTAVADTQTALVTEILAADAKGLARGQQTSGPTVSLVTTTITNDTVRVATTWVLTANGSIAEQGMFDSLTQALGVMFVRNTFPSVLNLDSGDQFSSVCDYVTSA